MGDLEFKAIVDRGKIPTSNAETELKCLVKVWPLATTTKSAEPLRSSICLVFDCSASMLLDGKLEKAIEAAKLIVDTISEIQRVSLVAFQSKVRVLVPECLCTGATKQQIKDQIDEIRGMTGGSTNMTDAIKVGLGILNQSPAEAKVMILLSDGIPDFPETAEKAAVTSSGVQFFAVGIGAEYKADQLLKLVTPSNGALFGATEPEKITEYFEQLANRIENFVYRNAELTIQFPKGVLAGLAYKASPEQAFLGNMKLDKNREVKIQIGNIERDKVYSFLFLATVPQKAASDFQVCEASVTYNVPSEQASKVLGAPVTVTYTDDRRATEELNGEVMEVFRRVSITQLAERFVAASKKNDANETAKYLRILIKRYEEIGDAAMKNHYEEILKILQEEGVITNDMLNASVVASTVVANGGEVPHVVDDEF